MALSGAALAYAAQQLGGPVSETEATVASGAAVAALVVNDPEAVALLLVNVGANDAYIGLTPAVSATNGIRLNANGGSITINVRDDFTLPARGWYVVSPAGASTIYVLRMRRFGVSQPPAQGG